MNFTKNKNTEKVLKVLALPNTSIILGCSIIFLGGGISLAHLVDESRMESMMEDRMENCLEENEDLSYKEAKFACKEFWKKGSGQYTINTKNLSKEEADVVKEFSLRQQAAQ